MSAFVTAFDQVLANEELFAPMQKFRLPPERFV